MRTLKAPAGYLSVAVLDRQISVDKDGLLRNLDDSTADAIQAHDAGFVVHAPAPVVAGAGIDVPARQAIERMGAEVDGLKAEVAAMGRNVLFAELKAMGVVVSRTLATEELREIWVAETAKADGAQNDAPKAE